jgi:hypothetical protein
MVLLIILFGNQDARSSAFIGARWVFPHVFACMPGISIATAHLINWHVRLVEGVPDGLRDSVAGAIPNVAPVEQLPRAAALHVNTGFAKMSRLHQQVQESAAAAACQPIQQP